MRNGFESISYLGPKIWEIIPSEIQACETFFEFNIKVKSLNPINCPCKLCKTYIGGAGYVWMMEQYTPSDISYWFRMLGYLTIKTVCKVYFGQC